MSQFSLAGGTRSLKPLLTRVFDLCGTCFWHLFLRECRISEVMFEGTGTCLVTVAPIAICDGRTVRNRLLSILVDHHDR